MPLLSLPPSPPRSWTRRPSRSRRRRSKRRSWAELPPDALLYVLHKLDDVELMFGGAARVCRSWRRAACGEPDLWRRVDFRETVSLGRMAALAIWFIAGQCEAFFGEHDVDDDLLLFLAEQAPSLKILHLIECDNVQTEAFTAAITKFPLLEELELSRCRNLQSPRVLQLTATACPQLKHLKHIEERIYWCPDYNRVAMAVAAMRELRSLQLFENDLDNQGLTAIIDGCTCLDSLDLRDCHNVNVYSSCLRAKCAHVKTKKIRPLINWRPWRSAANFDDFTDGSEYFQLGSPIISRCRKIYMCGGDDERDCGVLYAMNYHIDDDDDDDSSCFFSGAEEAGFEEHDRILDKSMRRYLRI